MRSRPASDIGALKEEAALASTGGAVRRWVSHRDFNYMGVRFYPVRRATSLRTKLRTHHLLFSSPQF